MIGKARAKHLYQNNTLKSITALYFGFSLSCYTTVYFFDNQKYWISLNTMFKKYYEYSLVFFLAIILTSVLYFFLSHLEFSEITKSKLQITIENASHRWNDLLYNGHHDKKPNQNVVLLAIDEPSIIEVGRWPWSRNEINKITEALLKYEVKTLTYDIIFSEKESAIADSNFVRTISKSPEKLTFGTFSDFSSNAQPYQDFCLTQAFLYTGGSSLAKINPFFSVDDNSNSFEEIEFNKLFIPIFQAIDSRSVKTYLDNYEVDDVEKLTQYQLNTLTFFKKQKVYEYCHSWLSDDDIYQYKFNPDLKKIYLAIFGVTNETELQNKLNGLISTTTRNPIPQYEMWRQNIDEIQNAALYTASFVAHQDPDGVVRNYPLIFRTGNQLGTSYIPSLALQAYLAATGYQALFKLESFKNQKKIDTVEVRDVSGKNEKLVTTLPTNYEGKLLIDYYGKQNTINYLSAKELLTNSEKLEYSVRSVRENGEFVVEKITTTKVDFLRNKNVIFGATAVGIYDIRTTPTDISYPGPEIHATVLSNLLNDRYLSYGKNEIQYSPFIFLLFITITLFLFIKLNIRSSSILFTVLAIVLFYLQKNFYLQGVVFHSSFLYFILLFTSFFITYIYKYFFQSRKSKEIKMAFSKYVSKDVVEEILKNKGAIELRGQKYFMSVYFSDIRGFTAFSEKMDPVELSELLNRYFTPMSKIITQHQGTIDKYIGDAIMAMFGAPINHKDHALQACRAALGCIEALTALNTEFAIRNWPEIKIGIGINTGFMNAGNIGSETIQNYTVIGDSVNLAARLESLTKEYDVKIIISEFTYEIVKNHFKCRELDKVKVKGKQELVTIYELISEQL